jgi:hypothetical protein
MKKIVGFSTILFILIIFTFLYSEPSFNGNSPGCAGGGCHSFKAGLVNAIPQGDLQVEVSLPSVSQGDKVGGELVDGDGNVVDVTQSTNNNPFILTAPSAGTYLVYAGNKEPSRDWDSVSVNLTVSAIDLPNKARIPERIQLLGNHPNPFNNITLIKFSLPQQKQIRLTIFNMRGQLIRNLVEGNFSSGIHQIMWDGTDNSGKIVSSGTYVYRLSSRNQNLSRKLVLSK